MVQTHDGPHLVAPTATEQSPLLADRPNNGENAIPSSYGEAELGSVPALQEPTNREIALTMSCIWVCLLPSLFFDIF
jgi:hypothetical protein